MFSPYNGPTDSQNIETENIEVEESHNDPTIKDIMKQSEHLEKVFFDSKKRVDLETDSVELDPVMLEAISTLTHARSVSVISQHILFNSIFTVDHEKKEGTCRLCKSKPIELRTQYSHDLVRKALEYSKSHLGERYTTENWHSSRIAVVVQKRLQDKWIWKDFSDLSCG